MNRRWWLKRIGGAVLGVIGAKCQPLRALRPVSDIPGVYGTAVQCKGRIEDLRVWVNGVPYKPGDNVFYAGYWFHVTA